MRDYGEPLIQDRMRDLRENTDFVSTLFESLTGYAIIAVDFDGNVIAFNEGARQIYGYTPEEVIGKQNIEIFFPEDFIAAGKLQQVIDELIGKGRFSREGEQVRKNGDTFPAQILFTLTNDSSGKVVGFTEIVEDLTERKRAEEAIRLSRASFHNVVEKSADGAIVVDRNGVVCFVNSAGRCLVNESKARELLSVGKLFGRPIVSGDVMEVDIVRGGGELGIAEMRVVDTQWDGEDAYLVSLRDITERKRAEEVAVRQERLAAMGALASIIGHEVRGPLSVIKNSAEFLRLRLGTSPDEKVKRHLDILQEEVDTSNKIIDDTLNFARLKELALTTEDVNSVVEAAIARLTVPANVRVVRRFGTDLTEVTVDVSQIQQVLFNIIANAIDAISEGGILTIVTGEQWIEERGQGFVEVSLQDTGVGIPKENLPKIFEPLFTTKNRGTGLGLAACRNIVNAHNGEIEVDSEVGKGTIVTVKLPVKQHLRKEVSDGRDSQGFDCG